MPAISFDLRFACRPGGAGVYTANLCRALLAQNHPVRWRFYTRDKIETQFPFLNNHLQNQTVLEQIPVRSDVLTLAHHLEFRRFNDDASLYHYPHFDAPLSMSRTPLVITLHDLYPLTIPGYCGPLKQQYFYHLARFNARRAAAVITISQQSRTDIINHLRIPDDKITVIPQGYAPEFRPITDHDLLDRVRTRHQLPEHFVYYCGNLKPHKNLARFLHAYAQLPRDLQQQFPFVLTGPLGLEQTDLRQLIEQLQLTDRVRLLGLVPESDLPAIYNLASLFVMPSLYEGFGMPPLEALACGTPVICSNAPALPEVVGPAARLFEPTDIDSISHTLRTALENDVNNPLIRQAALDRAAQFSWDRTAQLTWRVYQHILEQP